VQNSATAIFLRGINASLPAKPSAILIVSAHWEASTASVNTAPSRELLYDYYGFPKASYDIKYPAPTDAALGRRVVSLLNAAGVPAQEEQGRGFDHGVFVPLGVM
jgi:aromatic ring-opening dioxygenase catalytic subunit (LigB family)